MDTLSGGVSLGGVPRCVRGTRSVMVCCPLARVPVQARPGALPPFGGRIPGDGGLGLSFEKHRIEGDKENAPALSFFREGRGRRSDPLPRHFAPPQLVWGSQVKKASQRQSGGGQGKQQHLRKETGPRRAMASFTGCSNVPLADNKIH